MGSMPRTAPRAGGSGSPSRPGLPGRLLALVLALGAGALPASADDAPAETPDEPVRRLAISNKKWTGDLDRLVERRMIRVLAPYSRTLYFLDKGRERGLTADLVREFERFLNEKHRTGKRPITVYLIPTTRDRLLTGVAEGFGDLATGNLTGTPERERIVDFAVQEGRKVREVVVAGARAAPPATLEALGGREVHVRKSSSYHESLVALNARLR